MKDFAGKTAFITGGASGFGLALAYALSKAGMATMLGDIDAHALAGAVAGLREAGARADGVVCDVTDRASVQAAATATREMFGDVHLLCNNAGVLVAGPVERLTAADWDWCFAVNVMGVVNGVSAFLPDMIKHGAPGHILNVASVAGLRATPGTGPYCATKSAVIAFSEVLRADLAGKPIGVSVLCPNFMQTSFFSSGDKRQERFGGPRPIWQTMSDDHQAVLHSKMAAGLPPATIARIAIQGVLDDQFMVVTHPTDRDMLAERHAEIIRAFDWLEQTAIHA